MRIVTLFYTNEEMIFAPFPGRNCKMLQNADNGNGSVSRLSGDLGHIFVEIVHYMWLNMYPGCIKHGMYTIEFLIF